jgi:hypothetical protein
VELSGKRTRAVGLACAGRSDKQDLSAWLKTSFGELLTLSLFDDDAFQVAADLGRQHEVTEPYLGVRDREQGREFTTWLRNGNGTSRSTSALRGAGRDLGLVNEIAKLLRKLAVPLSGSVRSELDDHREEAIVIAFDVALQ